MYLLKPLRLLALTSAALALVACNQASATKEAAVAQPIVQGNQMRFPPGHPQLALLGVTAAEAGRPVAVEMPARLVWDEERTQRIYPAFAGRVMGIRADVGQKVAAGALLAQVASPDFGVAQADTAKAHADLRLAEKALQRQHELFNAGIVAAKDLEQAESDAARAQAEAARAAARTSLYGAGASVDQQLALRAGMAGVVVERNLNPGQELRPDQSGPGIPALFVVTDPSRMWAQIDVRESEAGMLQPGAKFELHVSAFPDRTFEGQVTATADFLDPATRTIKVRGTIDNRDRLLKAEMLATARIERMRGSGVLVPASAITLVGTTHRVFVQVQPGVFESRDVKLTYQGSKDAVVSKGLEVGEQVVTNNVLLLAQALRMAQEEAPAANLQEAAKAPVAAMARASESAKK